VTLLYVKTFGYDTTDVRAMPVTLVGFQEKPLRLTPPWTDDARAALCDSAPRVSSTIAKLARIRETGIRQSDSRLVFKKRVKALTGFRSASASRARPTYPGLNASRQSPVD
jgi:hypothetical protein